MPAWIITGGDVLGGHSAEVHGGGILVPSKTPKVDTMPGVWGETRRGFHDGTTPTHAQDQARYQLESATGKPDSTPNPGVRCELPANNKMLPLTLPWMPGILLHMEWPEFSLQ